MERVDKIINSFELQSTVFRRDFTVGNVKASMLFHPDITDVFILRSVLLACSGKHKAVGLNELLR